MTSPTVAISLGDPNGIGPEVTLKALQDEALRRSARYVLVGSAQVLRQHAERLGLDVPFNRITRDFDSGVDDPVMMLTDDEPHEVAFGAPTASGGRLALRAIERTVDLCLASKAHAMVTAPISKAALALAEYPYRGHTDFIAERSGAPSHTMMMVAGPLRVGLLTAHVALADVPKLVTPERIIEKLRVMHASLRNDFAIKEPRLAVLGLNPHAGDDGVMGNEEAAVIEPALARAKRAGIHAEGPFPADAYFANDGYKRHDAVLAMYHDQGLAPFKILVFDEGVNFTAGLPIVRASPDHGTAYDIAGKGIASSESMTCAIRLAIEIANQRKRK